MKCAYCGYEVDLNPLVQALRRMQPTWDLAIEFAQECADDTLDRVSPALKKKALRVVKLANRSQCGCPEDQCCSLCDPESFYKGEVQP